MTHDLVPDEPEDAREDPLYATIAKCSLAIKLAFKDAAVVLKQLSFPTGPGVTWGIFYPEGGPSVGLTILQSDLERVSGDDDLIAALVVEKIGLAGAAMGVEI